MRLTRADTNEALELPEDLRWTNELTWQALGQTNGEYSLSGALIIQQGRRLAGRPITLSGGWVWIDRATALKLYEWADIPELSMTLTLTDQRQFSVCFTRPALEGFDPVLFSAPEPDSAPYENITIHLITL